MTLFGAKMTEIGWCTLWLESVMIWLKDAYLWKGNIRFRDFVNEKAGLAVLWSYEYFVIFVVEISGITQNKNIVVGMATFGLCLLMLLMTENGVEIAGRIDFYWFTLYGIVLFFGRLAGMPGLQENKISYYENPAEILPNLALMFVVFFVMKWLYRKKALHKIFPASLCVILVWLYAFNSAIIWYDIKEEGRIPLKSVLALLGTLMLVNSLYAMILFLDGRRRRRLIELEEQCQKQFYHQMKQVQQKAGKFRHDLANHLQIIERYRQEGLMEEMYRYAQKLERRRAELNLDFYTEDPVMNFCFNQIGRLAEDRGISLTIDCQIQKETLTESDREQVIGQCLNILARCRKRKKVLQIGILHGSEGAVVREIGTADMGYVSLRGRKSWR